MTALLLFLAVILVGCGFFLMGQYLGYSLGFDDGWTLGERHAQDPKIEDIRWINFENHESQKP